MQIENTLTERGARYGDLQEMLEIAEVIDVLDDVETGGADA